MMLYPHIKYVCVYQVCKWKNEWEIFFFVHFFVFFLCQVCLYIYIRWVNKRWYTLRYNQTTCICECLMPLKPHCCALTSCMHVKWTKFWCVIFMWLFSFYFYINVIVGTMWIKKEFCHVVLVNMCVAQC